MQEKIYVQITTSQAKSEYKKRLEKFIFQRKNLKIGVDSILGLAKTFSSPHFKHASHLVPRLDILFAFFKIMFDLAGLIRIIINFGQVVEQVVSKILEEMVFVRLQLVFTCCSCRISRISSKTSINWLGRFILISFFFIPSYFRNSWKNRSSFTITFIFCFGVRSPCRITAITHRSSMILPLGVETSGGSSKFEMFNFFHVGIYCVSG